MDLRDYDRMPTVAVAMTPFPYSVEAGDGLDRAVALMTEHGVRHLPVKREGQVVGIISERDLRAPPVSAPGNETLCAGDLASPDPYLVDLHTPLDVALREMERRKLGVAVVMRGGRLSGILSVVDVCGLLAGILESRFRSGGGDDAA
jgi:acetoin utilization protein AcuB